MYWVRAYYRLAVVAILALLAIGMILPICMRLAIAPFTFASVDEVPKTEVALVLGASVEGGTPSPILADRADAAIALFNAGKASKILVTGDNGALTHDEVTPVRKYLLDAGIPAADIFLDHAGFDTYSSMYRARDVFRAASMTIVTQDFHLPRALWIARHLGITAYGVTAEGGTSSAYDYLREIPASAKAVFDVLTHREPKYLGPTFPLTGDGQSTWY
jgi:SanA protein